MPTPPMGEPTASCHPSYDLPGPQEGSPAQAPTAQHLGLSAPDRDLPPSSPTSPSSLGVIPGASAGLPHTALLAVPAMPSGLLPVQSVTRETVASGGEFVMVSHPPPQENWFKGQLLDQPPRCLIH